MAYKPDKHGRDHCPGGEDPIPCLFPLASCSVRYAGGEDIPTDDWTELPANGDWFPGYTNPAADLVLSGASGPHMAPLMNEDDELDGRIEVTPSPWTGTDPPLVTNTGIYLVQAWGGWGPEIPDPLWGGQVGIQIKRLDQDGVGIASTFTESSQDHWTDADILWNGSDDQLIHLTWLTWVETSETLERVRFVVEFYQDSGESQGINRAALMVQQLGWFAPGTYWG